MDLVPGTVAMLESHPGRHEPDGVGFRVADGDGATRVVWPSYLAVHLDPDDSTEPCWRCADLAVARSR
jgi:hypothetical protein